MVPHRSEPGTMDSAQRSGGGWILLVLVPLGSVSCQPLTHGHVDVGTQQGCALAFSKHQHLQRRWPWQ